MNKQIDYDYSIAKRKFDSSRLGKQEQIKVPQRPMPQKIQNKTEQITQKIPTNKKNEGIFRNF